MKTSKFIISILEAGRVSRETLEEYVAELIFRLEQMQAAKVDQRKARQWLQKQLDERETLAHKLSVMLKAERLDGNSLARLRFLEQHVKDLNERINAAAKEAFMDGRASGFNKGVEEGLKRASNFENGRARALAMAESGAYEAGFTEGKASVEKSTPKVVDAEFYPPPAVGTKVIVGGKECLFHAEHVNGKDWWIDFGPGIGVWAYHPSDVTVPKKASDTRITWPPRFTDITDPPGIPKGLKAHDRFQIYCFPKFFNDKGVWQTWEVDSINPPKVHLITAQEEK